MDKNYFLKVQTVKSRFIVNFSIMSISVLLYFGIAYQQEINKVLYTAEVLVAISLILNLIYYKRGGNENVVSAVLTSFTGLMILAIYFQGGIEATGNVWVFIFPILAFYLNGEKLGGIYVVIFVSIFMLININIFLGNINNDFSFIKQRQTTIALVVVVLLGFFNERLKRLSFIASDEANKDLRSIFNNLQDTFFRTSQSGEITIMSPSFYAITGFSEHEVLGKSISSFYFNPSEREDFLEYLYDSDGVVSNYETRFKSKTSKEIWVLISAQYILSEDGEILGIEGTAKDISELKIAQNELLKLNTHLENRIEKGVQELRHKDELMLQQARLAQMGEMLSMIAHQWRQPLSSIAAVTGNIKIDIALDEKISTEYLEENIHKIDSNINFLSNTIDDFRNFFKSDKIEKATSFENIITKAMNVLNPAIVKVNVKVDKINITDTQIITFESELIQVIINILNNATDVLQDLDGKRKIQITQSSSELYNILEISDNGGGIPQDILDRVFDPYFSTKMEKNGTGLGLYMSKIIVQEHCKGILKVTNNDDGACFKIELPKE